MKLSEELKYRGFVAQHTFANPEDLDKCTHKFYFGADPSADSMTIGNLAAIMMCKVFVKHGYEPTLLVGGATGRIGDPKENEERQLKSADEVDRNATALQKQFRQILGTDVNLVNNYEWFRDMKYLDFLRDIGKQFSMTQLLDRQFVRDRIGKNSVGLSYAEFSYSLMQGYDFLHLFRTRGIDLQLCGADQYGNCTSGMHLIRQLENARADVWSCPLIIDKVSGKKFGKSEGNAVWLDPLKTSPFKFYQFWLNVADDSVIDYMKIYTEFSREEIGEIAQQASADPGEHFAQKKLALAVTELIHGDKTAHNVAYISRILFDRQFNFKDFKQTSSDELDLLATEIPTIKLRNNLTVVDALTESSIASSHSNANRLLKQKSISINGQKIAVDRLITETSLIKKGKNQFILVR